MAVVHKRVFIDPPCAGRIRPDDWMYARGQTTRDLLHVFQDTRPCPVQVCSVLKDGEDVGVAKHRLCPHGLYVWCGEKRGASGIGDLSFDEARSWTGQGRGVIHSHMGIACKRTERRVPQGP